MDLRQGILSSARALGVNPVDLATAISYETAGTFDPTKRGPTTQWGQHRGLIQFGEPQAQKYGVSWDDPVGSQLGEDGAVVKYLRDTGVQPGMGLLDIYSAINAGGVGRYNRSDANNGGAPGTVADKVRNQMAGHRAKAEALFGGGGADTAAGGLTMSPGGQQDTLGAPMQAPEQQRGLLFDKLGPKAQEYLTPERVARLQMALEGMTLRPNQGVMMAAQETIKAGGDRKQRNRTAEWLAKNGRSDLAEGVMSGAIDGKSAVAASMQKADPTANLKVINGQLVDISTGQVVGDYRDPDAPPTSDDIREYQFAKAEGFDGTLQEWITSQRKAGATQNTVTVGGQDTSIGTVPQGYAVIEDPSSASGYRMVPIEGGPEDTSEQRDAKQSARQTSSDVVVNAATRALGAARDRSVSGVLGAAAAVNPGSQNAELYRQVGALKSVASAEALNAMRRQSTTGGALGNVTEKELVLLSQQAGALDPMSPNFERDLSDYVQAMLRTIHGRDAGDAIYRDQFEDATKPRKGAATHRYNPETGKVEAIK